MTDSLVVVLDDTVAGTLTRLRGGRLRFDYDEEYRQRPNATPLSVSMPTQVRSHPHGVITPWLWGLLPDNEGRAGALGAAVPRLRVLAVLDARHTSRPRLRGRRSVRLRPTTLEAMVREAGRRDMAHRRGRGSHVCAISGKTRLPGSDRRSRASSASRARRRRRRCCSETAAGASRPASIATSHILKPAVTGLDDHDLNEHLCLDAARRAGLTVATNARWAVRG